jgi:hypothetical protein
LLLLLGVAVYILVTGWSSAGDATTDISTTGYVAMAFGVVATLALGIGFDGLDVLQQSKPLTLTRRRQAVGEAVPSKWSGPDHGCSWRRESAELKHFSVTA